MARERAEAVSLILTKGRNHRFKTNPMILFSSLRRKSTKTEVDISNQVVVVVMSQL